MILNGDPWPSMFEHPGKIFLESHGPIENFEGVLAYVDFLRAQIGVGDRSPVDLDSIYKKFAIPTPKKAPLPNQQGLLLLPEAGLILINQDDIETRQRFTEAHELMELLFDALPGGKGWAENQKGPFKHHTKERLCNLGAAHLLMPSKFFSEQGLVQGISFATARKLARDFEVSLTAALVQLVRVSTGQQAVVLWRMKHTKGDLSKRPPANQLELFDSPGTPGPAKKLRVEWSLRSADCPFIPQNKSVHPESKIYEAWEQSRFSAGKERLDLGPFFGAIRSENLPLSNNGESSVLSLLVRENV